MISQFVNLRTGNHIIKKVIKVTSDTVYCLGNNEVLQKQRTIKLLYPLSEKESERTKLFFSQGHIDAGYTSQGIPYVIKDYKLDDPEIFNEERRIAPRQRCVKPLNISLSNSIISKAIMIDASETGLRLLIPRSYQDEVSTKQHIKISEAGFYELAADVLAVAKIQWIAEDTHNIKLGAKILGNNRPWWESLHRLAQI